jgi:hypothetical protein
VLRRGASGVIAMRRLLIAPVVGALLATSAVACIGARVASVADVDQALAEARLPDADAAKVRRLREQIVDLIARGDGDGAVAAEAEAMAILGHELQVARGGCARWVRKTS